MSVAAPDQSIRNAPGARTPRIVSSGFATVDMRLAQRLLASPGGTAANVARILNSLGWESALVGTVGQDPSGNLLKSTLNNEGVLVDDLWLDPKWLTPVLVQTDDRGDHGWRFSCPICGTRYAKHRPSPEGNAHDVLEKVDAPDVFFFDRTSLFTLSLAETWAAAGTIVVFEPSGLGRPQLFERAVRSSSIVKYSSERGEPFEDLVTSSSAALVKTLGARGSLVRSSPSTGWREISTGPVESVVDSAGAGDWTTAGILDALLGESPGWPLSELGDRLVDSVANGHRLGAAACGWEGVFPRIAASLAYEDIELFSCPRVLAHR